MSARARHHFTTLRQVNQLIEASEAEPDLGFMARLLALCSLPRTNPRDLEKYIRRNGPYKLILHAGGDPARLPFGNLPRLLLAWVCSEAVRTQRLDLVLGRSLYEFMRKLGLEDRSGSPRGDRARLKNQMRRLFTCSVQLVYAEGDHELIVSSFVAERAEFWWSVARPDAPSLWDSKIELGEKFFEEIIRHPVPLDMNILRSLKRSPLGLDLYFWLTYRTFTLKAPLTLSWRQLYKQFGAHPADGPADISGFRRQCLRELKKIKRAWPDLNYGTVTAALVIEPSPPRIPAGTTPPHQRVGAQRLDSAVSEGYPGLFPKRAAGRRLSSAVGRSAGGRGSLAGWGGRVAPGAAQRPGRIAWEFSTKRL